MSLISKPFDDSGVELVDRIALYGSAISARVEHLRTASRRPGVTDVNYSGLEIGMALCDALNQIIGATRQETYRSECARAASTLFLEAAMAGEPCGDQDLLMATAASMSPDPVLKDAIEDILRDPEVLPADDGVTTQTVLLALVWSALVFAMESTPLPAARQCVRRRITGGASALPHH
jgi:hypothetical protein